MTGVDTQTVRKRLRDSARETWEQLAGVVGIRRVDVYSGDHFTVVEGQ